MPQAYKYYVPVVLNQESQVGFFIHIYETDVPINSEEEVYKMIDALTRKHVPEPEKGTLPVIPLGFTLLTAKRGPGVEALKPKGNGHGDHY